MDQFYLEQENRRLIATKQAYWQNTPSSDDDAQALRAFICKATGKEPTVQQIEAFFMSLPAPVFGLAAAYGFGDEEVVAAMREFVEDSVVAGH